MLEFLTIVPARPVPVNVKLAELPDYADYEKVAAELKFRPRQMVERDAEVARRELIGFMLDQGMPVYDNKAVDRYMTALAKRRKQTFVWARLDGHGNERFFNDDGTRWSRDRDGELHIISDGDHGKAIESAYKHAVPIDILKRAASIRKQFPDTAFYVSDYAVVNPDPFIMARRGRSQHVVFGVWDEPGFGAIGRDKGR